MSSKPRHRKKDNNDQNSELTPIVKEPAPQGDGSTFAEGAIVRIKLTNFVTYDSVEFRPGPFLNIIIGPNGTGKSTLVCGICLGLAGKPSVLGRASHPSEFIKYGCQKATTEIELYDTNEDNLIIKREIHKNSSTWTVRGRNTTQKAVETLVANRNIQVGNLCQFLPQDKVADFAKMSQAELLENTEKAVGPPGMYENHTTLKTARKDLKDLVVAHGNQQDHLEKERQKNARLEGEVKNYQERQEHLRRIQILEMKRPWTEYECKRLQFVKEKAERDQLGEKVKEAHKINRPLNQQLERVRQQCQSLDTEMRKKQEAVKEHAHQAHMKSKAIEEQTDKVADANEELKAKKTEENNRIRKLNDLRRHLTMLENDLESVEEQEDTQPQLDRNNQEERQVNRKRQSLHQQADQLRADISGLKKEIQGLQANLKKVLDVGNRRLEMLHQKHKPTYQAVLWLRANMHRFKATIHEPIMLQVNVRDPQHAKYIETTIPFKDMRSFVCEDAEDMEVFLKSVRDEQGLQINAVMAPDTALSSFKPEFPITRYSNYGFHSYLRSLFDCNDAIMTYLCSMYRVHTIPIGDHRAKENLESLQGFPELRLFYTENHRYAVKVSKYSGQRSSLSSELRQASLLTASVDVSQEQEIRQLIKENQEQLSQKEEDYQGKQKHYDTLESQLEALRNEKKELMHRKNTKKGLVQQINTKKQNIERLERESINIEAQEAKAKDLIRRINLKQCSLLQQLCLLTSRCLDLGKERVCLSLKHAATVKQMIEIEDRLREQSVELTNLQKELEEMKERAKETKKEAQRLIALAKKATNTKDNEELSSEIKRAFETLPVKLEDIEAAIHEEQARADCAFNTDGSVVQEYQERKTRIARLEQEVEEKRSTLEHQQGETERIKAEWLEPLKSLMARINQNFSYFFRCMRCAGEVDLFVPENEEDYEKYGIQIKVKFRDSEQLRVLTQHQQSGGERSVSTVLYMMALQELTRCPFRCVDEINQGMDPINERKVFELIVQTACKKNNSQYFMLTPKLLPDLDYSDNMTVLCVNNGPNMVNHTEWNLKKFIKRRRKIGNTG